MGAKRGGRWADGGDDDAEEEGGRAHSAEPGELPDGQRSKKQRHAPIVWAPKPGAAGGAPGAAPGGQGGPPAQSDTARPARPESDALRRATLEKVESTTRLAGMARGGSPGAGALPPRSPAKPQSAAEIAAAELRDFQRRQDQVEDLGFDPNAPPAQRSSPSGSDDGGARSP